MHSTLYQTFKLFERSGPKWTDGIFIAGVHPNHSSTFEEFGFHTPCPNCHSKTFWAKKGDYSWQLERSKAVEFNVLIIESRT
jgi:hypothetical protein